MLPDDRICVCASIYLIISVGIERYLAVCRWDLSTLWRWGLTSLHSAGLTTLDRSRASTAGQSSLLPPVTQSLKHKSHLTQVNTYLQLIFLLITVSSLTSIFLSNILSSRPASYFLSQGAVLHNSSPGHVSCCQHYQVPGGETSQDGQLSDRNISYKNIPL